MGLFDQLFKSKSPPSEEKLVDTGAPEGDPNPSPDAEARTTPPVKPDPSAFLHPKNFVPRTASLAPASARSLATSGVKTLDRKAPPVPAKAEHIVLTLGDVLSRIPTPYLKAGPHDPKRELRFHINDLSSDIARGRAAVPLSRIADLAPDIFVRSITRDEDTEIRLPLQKLVEQIGLLRARPGAPAATGAEKAARSAELGLAGTVFSPPAEKEISSVQIPTGIAPVLPRMEALHELRPMVELTGENLVFGTTETSSPSGEKLVELKPAVTVEAPATPLSEAPAWTEVSAPLVPTTAFVEPEIPAALPATVVSPVSPIESAQPSVQPLGEIKPPIDVESSVVLEPPPRPVVEVPAQVELPTATISGEPAESDAPPATMAAVAGPTAELVAQQIVAEHHPRQIPPVVDTPISTGPTVPPLSTVTPGADLPVKFEILPTSEEDRSKELTETILPKVDRPQEVSPVGSMPVSAANPETESPKVETVTSSEMVAPLILSAVPTAATPVQTPPAVVAPEAALEAKTVEPAPALVTETPVVGDSPRFVGPETQKPVWDRIEGGSLSSSEPVRPAEAAPEAAVPTEPLPIVIDWPKLVSEITDKVAVPAGVAVTGDPVEPLPAPPAESAERSQPGVSATEKAEAAGERIELSLAAVLRDCPPALITQPLPLISDAVRISLPFEPIDRQLARGAVEIGSAKFVAALPVEYQKFFTSHPEVSVPLPLEEIFQNLPSTESTAYPRPGVPPPLVLRARPMAEKPPEVLVTAAKIVPEPAPNPVELRPEAAELLPAPADLRPTVASVSTVSTEPLEPVGSLLPPALAPGLESTSEEIAKSISEPALPSSSSPAAESTEAFFPEILPTTLDAPLPTFPVEEIQSSLRAVPAELLVPAVLSVSSVVAPAEELSDGTPPSGTAPEALVAETLPPSVNESSAPSPESVSSVPSAETAPTPILPPLPTFQVFTPPPPLIRPVEPEPTVLEATVVVEKADVPATPVTATATELTAPVSEKSENEPAAPIEAQTLAPEPPPATEPAAHEVEILPPPPIAPVGVGAAIMAEWIPPLEDLSSLAEAKAEVVESKPKLDEPNAEEPKAESVAPKFVETESKPEPVVSEPEPKPEPVVPIQEVPVTPAVPEESVVAEPPKPVEVAASAPVEKPADAPAEPVATPAFTAPVRTFMPPPLLRPFIAPPPIFGLAPATAAPVAEPAPAPQAAAVPSSIPVEPAAPEVPPVAEATKPSAEPAIEIRAVVSAPVELPTPPVEAEKLPEAPTPVALPVEPESTVKEGWNFGDEPVAAEGAEIPGLESAPQVDPAWLPLVAATEALVKVQPTTPLEEWPSESGLEVLNEVLVTPPPVAPVAPAADQPPIPPAEVENAPTGESSPVVEPAPQEAKPEETPAPIFVAPPLETSIAAALVPEPLAPAEPVREAAETVPVLSIPEAFPVEKPDKGPLPLFQLPRIGSDFEIGLTEIIPPPAFPLRRFDQDALQAIFMTEDILDLPKISRLAAQLPGIHACVIATRDQACTGGTLPDGFDLAALLGLAPRVGEAAGRLPIGLLKHFTLYGERYSVSFFERHGLSLCAVHRPRSFVPGVREKLVAIADELSKF